MEDAWDPETVQNKTHQHTYTPLPPLYFPGQGQGKLTSAELRHWYFGLGTFVMENSLLVIEIQSQIEKKFSNLQCDQNTICAQLTWTVHNLVVMPSKPKQHENKTQGAKCSC